MVSKHLKKTLVDEVVGFLLPALVELFLGTGADTGDLAFFVEQLAEHLGEAAGRNALELAFVAGVLLVLAHHLAVQLLEDNRVGLRTKSEKERKRMKANERDNKMLENTASFILKNGEEQHTTRLGVIFLLVVLPLTARQKLPRRRIIQTANNALMVDRSIPFCSKLASVC